MDDANCPADGSKGNTSWGIGVSRHSARTLEKAKRVYAYEIPDVVLVGFGGHFIDNAVEGDWESAGWDPKGVQVGDWIGVLVHASDGDLVIFHNDMVVRLPSSLAEEPVLQDSASMKSGAPEPKATHLTLTAVVDLCGRVSKVSLMPQKQPPNVHLEARKFSDAGA